MIDRFVMAIAASGICALLAAPLALCESEADGPPSFDKYKVITERNIFLRERPRPAQASSVRRPPPPPPESPFTLTGVIRQGDEYIAFVEEAKRNVTSRVRVGESIADGRVSRITLDGI
ncbi:unnamed protein product, partial [marine sediment metagenome]